jgi:hypothetical protein
MEESPRYELIANVRINLPGLVGRLHRQLQTIISNVAIGLAAPLPPEDEIPELPGREIGIQLSRRKELWDPDRLKPEYRRWIVAAAIRDALEEFTISHLP